MGYTETKIKRDWALNSSWGAYGLGTGSVQAWVGFRRTKPVQGEYIRAVSPFLFIFIFNFSLFFYSLNYALFSLLKFFLLLRRGERRRQGVRRGGRRVIAAAPPRRS